MSIDYPDDYEILFKGSKVELVRLKHQCNNRGWKNRLAIRLGTGLCIALSDRISGLFLEILNDKAAT